MMASQDRLKPRNVELSRLVTLTNQLLQKRLTVLKTVDVTYGEQVRLPAQYYMPRTHVESIPSTLKKTRKRSEEERADAMATDEKGRPEKRTIDQDSIELAKEGDKMEQTEIDSIPAQTEKRKRKRKQQSRESPTAKKPKV